MKTANIEAINPLEASESILSGINDLYVEIEQETLPDDPPRPREEYIAWLRSRPSFRRSLLWVVRDEERVIGVSELEWEEKDQNRHLAGIYVGVTAGERRKGLATQLLAPVADTAKKLGRSTLDVWMAGDSVHEGFARHMGATFSMNEFHNRLFLEELDRSLLDDWINRASQRASEYSIEFWEGPSPEEDLERFAAVMDSMNNAPRPDSWEDDHFTPAQVSEQEECWEAAGFNMWRAVARHNPTGEIGGYTTMLPNPWRPEIAEQWDTGVLEAHQNRGLGRWLKAAMLVKLLDERPAARFVDTGNATTNRPMLAINNALGFRPVETWATWEIKTETLEATLAGSGRENP